MNIWHVVCKAMESLSHVEPSNELLHGVTVEMFSEIVEWEKLSHGRTSKRIPAYDFKLAWTDRTKLHKITTEMEQTLPVIEAWIATRNTQKTLNKHKQTQRNNNLRTQQDSYTTEKQSFHQIRTRQALVCQILRPVFTVVFRLLCFCIVLFLNCFASVLFCFCII